MKNIKKLLLFFVTVMFLSFVATSTFPETGATLITVQELQENSVYLRHLGNGVIEDDSLAAYISSSSGGQNWSNSSNIADSSHEQNGAEFNFKMFDYNTITVECESRGELRVEHLPFSRPRKDGVAWGAGLTPFNSLYATTPSTIQNQTNEGDALVITGHATDLEGNRTALVDFVPPSGGTPDGVINDIVITNVGNTQTATITTTNGGTPFSASWIDDEGCNTDCDSTNELTKIALDDGIPTIAGKEGDRYFDGDWGGDEWVHDGTQWNKRILPTGVTTQGNTDVVLSSSNVLNNTTVNVKWERLNNEVKFWTSFTATSTSTAGASGNIQITLPVPSDLTNKHQLVCVGDIYRDDSSGFAPLIIRKIEAEINNGIEDRIEITAQGFSQNVPYHVVLKGNYQVF